MRTSILVGITMMFLLLLTLPVAASDFTLGIFGNANKDETINMQDVACTEQIILEYKDETQLADAKYDGEIDILDVIQIELIIFGKEKELTVESGNPRNEYAVVTIQKPIESVITRFFDSAEVLRTLNVADKIVAVGTRSFQENSQFFPELSKAPYVAAMRYEGLDYEAVLSLNPDIFLAWSGEEREKLPVIPMVHSKLYGPGSAKDVQKLGYIFDKEEEAEEYIDWHDGWISMIEKQVEGIPEDERPRVLVGIPKHGRVFAVYKGTDGRRGMDELMSMVPMNSIGQSFPTAGAMPEVDMEWVIDQNPDIIIIATSMAGEGRTSYAGYDLDDPAQVAAEREAFLNRPELAEITAVKEGRVYMMEYKLFSYSQSMIIGGAYLAKWIYPELDLDPEAIHQEYLDRFQHIDYDLDEHGIFAYPPIEIDGGLAGIPDRYRDR